MLVPLQRRAPGGPERQTLLVAGSTAAVGEAVLRAAQAGWDTWAVTRTGPAGWRLTVARRD